MDIFNDCLLHFKTSFITQLISSRKNGEICEQICLLSQSALAIIWN